VFIDVLVKSFMYTRNQVREIAVVFDGSFLRCQSTVFASEPQYGLTTPGSDAVPAETLAGAVPGGGAGSAAWVVALAARNSIEVPLGIVACHWKASHFTWVPLPQVAVKSR
jgi:hypothetical protein